jgi:hypothetical protein
MENLGNPKSVHDITAALEKEQLGVEITYFNELDEAEENIIIPLSLPLDMNQTTPVSAAK